MKIAFKHLSERIQSKVNIDEVSKKLFQLGHEHTIENGIFDIEFTPNRGDCLSVKGLLRDLSIFYEIDNDYKYHDKLIPSFSLDFKNECIDMCPHISFLKIEIEEKISSYKGPLKKYFTDLKINSNNFFTDVSNFVAYEIGQPTHCYESSKLSKSLKLTSHNKNVAFDTLLDKKITLRDKNLVFKSQNEIINLAGIIGSKETSCSKDTRSAIVESAYFNPESIIGKSVKYDINSDAAYKFERGTDPINHIFALKRFIKIVEDHAKICSLELFTKDYKNYEEKIIHYDFKIINKILGITVPAEDQLFYLKRFGFYVKDELLTIPSYRSDIFNQNDIAEEIARAIGYDNIKRKNLSVFKNYKVDNNLNENKIKSFLIDNGFYETISFPFTEHKTKESLSVDNPLDSNKSFLRTNLKQSLIENLLFNERRQKDSIKLFEVSNIYSFGNNLKSQRKIGIIASGRVDNNYIDFSKKIDESYLKALLKKLGICKYNNLKLISRDTLNSKSKNKIYYFECLIQEMQPLSINPKINVRKDKKFIKYNKISEFPASIKDISFSLSSSKNLKSLEHKILNYKNEIIKTIFVFDYFKKNEDEIKIGFRFVFQSVDRTITDNEVSSVLDEIIKETLSIENVEIPGLKINE